jgi:hypothetical protein
VVSAAQDSFTARRGRLLDSTSTPPVFEALLDVPGTYDCEIVGGALRCMVFAAQKDGAAEQRYQQLVKILRAWLPSGWTSAEQLGDNEKLLVALGPATGRCPKAETLASHLADTLAVPASRSEPADEYRVACGGFKLWLRACQRSNRVRLDPSHGVDHEFQLDASRHAGLRQGRRIADRRLLE